MVNRAFVKYMHCKLEKTFSLLVVCQNVTHSRTWSHFTHLFLYKFKRLRQLWIRKKKKLQYEDSVTTEHDHETMDLAGRVSRTPHQRYPDTTWSHANIP